MASNAKPIRLLCLGAHYKMALNLQAQLQPHFQYCAILTKIEPKQTYSLENLQLLLDALYPAPDGVIVGGGFTEEEGEEVRKVTAAHGEGTVKFIKVPVGTVERVGVEGLVGTIKELLGEAFDVKW